MYPNTATGRLEALIGIDLDEQPGEQSLPLTVSLKSGQQQTSLINFSVLKANFPTQQLTLPESQVSLSPENEARAAREQQAVLKLFAGPGQKKHWSGPLIQPIKGKVSTAFGLRRIMNGKPRNPHSGIDLRGPAGLPVAAAASGSIAYTGEHFFSGNSIFIDHGTGIFTIYFHLQTIAVTTGQTVEQGELIGTVGSTGRSTGPHLHWGARINNQRIDPLALVGLLN